MEVVKGLIEKEKPPKIATVGDQVSQDLTDHSLPPDLMIVDNKIMRKEIPPISAKADRTTRVKNPPGTITEEAWNAIEAASRISRRTKIIVDGEEDLLALVTILTVPEGSLVFYGQPRKGVVAVRATKRMKEKVEKTIEAMKRD